MKTKFYATMMVCICLFSAYTIVCPPSEVTYLPDMEDCSAYFECYNGMLTHYQCPAGLFWNDMYLMCCSDFDVDCGDRPVLEAPGEYVNREKAHDPCKCMDISAPNGEVFLPGTKCIPSGTGKKCNYYSLCSVPGYGPNCYVQDKKE